jgi:carbonic anhydrase
MRLIEAIIEANHRAANPAEIVLDVQPYPDELPVVALTCIDPRLNRLFPEVLGIPEDQFIWLRNAGNIIFDSMSSMTRTLALGCAIKGGKEICIIGHTDCKVGKTSMVELTDRMRAMGVDRTRLPDNLTEFFGMFASERQNVMRAAELIRNSPLIGSKVPVHGLLIDTDTGRLEWLVNGYQTMPGVAPAGASTASAISLPEFKIGEMKFPDTRIGEVVTHAADKVSSIAHRVESIAEKVSQTIHQHTRGPESSGQQQTAAPGAEPAGALRLSPDQMYKVMGDDKKVYGPVLGKEVERWVAEGRIDLNTLAQKVGSKTWKRLAEFVGDVDERQQRHSAKPPTIPFNHDPNRFK